MKLSEFQAQNLFLIARESLRISNDFPMPFEQRKTLVEDIINQQSRKLVELDKAKMEVSP